jgi:hypothetical protein
MPRHLPGRRAFDPASSSAHPQQRPKSDKTDCYCCAGLAGSVFAGTGFFAAAVAGVLVVAGCATGFAVAAGTAAAVAGFAATAATGALTFICRFLRIIAARRFYQVL